MSLSSLPTGNLAGLPVLVVDDDPSNAKVLTVVLNSEGCFARSAGSAEEALELLDSWSPRVVILDLVLPLMSGVLLAQRLKTDPRTRDMILIAVTAVSGDHVEQVARDAGCVEYLRKPIDVSSFVHLLSRHSGGVS
jgi:CheY-like chemotaxis protein